MLALGYWVYAFAEVRIVQSYQSWRLDQIRQGQPATSGDYVTDEAARLWDWATGKPPTRPITGRGAPLPINMPPPAEGSLVGRIAIPRIGVSSIILEGDDASVLRDAAGHIPGTALPGDGGNVALAGHRDTLFRGLRDARRGDEITLTTAAAVYRYRVASTEVVGPQDVAVLKASAKPTLTLVTCYPFNYVGSAPERFIVHADEVPAAFSRGGAAAVAETTLRLPRALPGESAEQPLRAARARHRVEPRHYRSRRPELLARRAAAEDQAADDDAELPARGPQRTRGLAARLRAQWGRIFAHLRANKAAGQGDNEESDPGSQPPAADINQ